MKIFDKLKKLLSMLKVPKIELGPQPITLPISPENLLRVEAYYQKLAKDEGGEAYMRNQYIKAESRKGKVKVLGHFYNPISGRNQAQERWVDKCNVHNVTKYPNHNKRSN